MPYYGQDNDAQLANINGEKINPATEDKQDDIISALSGISYSIRIAESAPYTYIGKAVIASAEGDAVWQVQRLDETSGLKVLWADGNSNFDNVWTNYGSLSYS